MAKNFSKGWRELPHTADWALEVWAPDLAQLFETAAQGMYALMEVGGGEAAAAERSLALEEGDPESLLVRFLAELLYLLESERLVFPRMALELEQNSLRARLWGGMAREQRKEIKAVTYHNLAIRQQPGRVEVTIVFDV